MSVVNLLNIEVTGNISILSFMSHCNFLNSCNHQFGTKWASPHVAITAVFLHACCTAVLLLHLKRNLSTSSDSCCMLYLSLSCLGRLSASTSSPPLPAPKLDIYSRSKSAVVLVCQAPEGHRGVNFMLYRTREKVLFFKDIYIFSDVFCLITGLLWFYSSLCFSSFIEVDSQELQSGAEEVQFTVRVNEGNSVQLFCCLYKDQDGHYSVFSPYLQLEHTGGVSMFFFFIENLYRNCACDWFKNQIWPSVSRWKLLLTQVSDREQSREEMWSMGCSSTSR